MTNESQNASASEPNHNDIPVDVRFDQFTENIANQLVLLLSDLRQIKRLVGSLSVEEDELEQVWRIADTIQNQLLGIVGDLEADESSLSTVN